MAGSSDAGEAAAARSILGVTTGTPSCGDAQLIRTLGYLPMPLCRAIAVRVALRSVLAV